MLEIVEGDMVVVLSVPYVVEKNENGALYGVSTKEETLTIEIRRFVNTNTAISSSQNLNKNPKIMS